MQNIFKSTYRNFVRKPATNLINLGGLAVSLALVIILSVYSYSELTTDNYHKNGDRIYLCIKNDEAIYTSALLKEQIDLSVPEVETTVRIGYSWEDPSFQAGEKEPISSRIFFADDRFFNVFTYHAIEGNLETALKEPLSLVITKTFALKLFGKESAIGKTVKYNNNKLFIVSAVIDEPPGNSILSFQVLTSIASLKIVDYNPDMFSSWGYTSFLTFVTLKDGSSAKETGAKILAVIPESDRKGVAGIFKGYEGNQLLPLKNLYFMKFKWDPVLKCGDKLKVLILVFVAGLILLIALINFINISSAQWFEKIRQTGVMKVIGATRSSILRNVLFETFLFFLGSLIIAIVLAIISAPLVGSLTGIRVNHDLFLKPTFLLISLFSTSFLSMMFSLIPAIRISSSNAIDNLKKKVSKHPSNSFSRSILVSAQFTIAIVLIAFTVLVQKQVNFGSSNLGINQENIIGIKLSGQLNQKIDVLKRMLEEKPELKGISFSEYYPGENVSSWIMDDVENGKKMHFEFTTFNADADFLKLMGLQLTKGRFYSDDFSTDTGKVIVNETFVREHKLADPIGVKFSIVGSQSVSEIIGVVRDFHFKSVNEPIASLAIRNEKSYKYCLAKVQSADFNSMHHLIQDIASEASDLSPSFPVEISFFDQAIENLYQSELQFRRTFSLFAGCAIVICCLGILAMSLFACQRRIKEIGIRKVNGARITEVMTMLNRDFVKWVAIAFVIATPIAWYTMHKWLESFAYKTDLSWWIFALAGLLALGIALLTVSWQSWKAATRNPVEALRYE